MSFSQPAAYSNEERRIIVLQVGNSHRLVRESVSVELRQFSRLEVGSFAYNQGKVSQSY